MKFEINYMSYFYSLLRRVGLERNIIFWIYCDNEMS